MTPQDNGAPLDLSLLTDEERELRAACEEVLSDALLSPDGGIGLMDVFDRLVAARSELNKITDLAGSIFRDAAEKLVIALSPEGPVGTEPEQYDVGYWQGRKDAARIIWAEAHNRPTLRQFSDHRMPDTTSTVDLLAELKAEREKNAALVWKSLSEDGYPPTRQEVLVFRQVDDFPWLLYGIGYCLKCEPELEDGYCWYGPGFKPTHWMPLPPPALSQSTQE